MIYLLFRAISSHLIEIGFLCKNKVLFYNKHKKILQLPYYSEDIFKEE